MYAISWYKQVTKNMYFVYYIFLYIHILTPLQAYACYKAIYLHKSISGKYKSLFSLFILLCLNAKVQSPVKVSRIYLKQYSRRSCPLLEQFHSLSWVHSVKPRYIFLLSIQIQTKSMASDERFQYLTVPYNGLIK